MLSSEVCFFNTFEPQELRLQCQEPLPTLSLHDQTCLCHGVLVLAHDCEDVLVMFPAVAK